MATASIQNAIQLEQLSAEGLRDFIRSNRDDVGSIADLSDKALKKLSTAELYALAQRVVVAMPKAGQNRAEAALAQRIQDNSKALSAALALWDKTGLGSDQSVQTKALTQASVGIIDQLKKSGDNASAYVLKEIEKKFGKNPSASEFMTGLSQLTTLPEKQMLAKGLTTDQVAELAKVLSVRVSDLAKTQYAPVLQAQVKRIQDEIINLRTLDTSLRDQATKAGLDSTDLEAALMPEMNVPATEPEPSQQTSASDLLNSQEETLSEPYIGEYIPGTGPAATIQRKDGVKVTIPASILDDKARLQAIVSGKEIVTLTAEDVRAMNTPATEAPVSNTVDFSAFKADPYAGVANVDFVSQLLDEPARASFNLSDMLNAPAESAVGAPVLDEATNRAVEGLTPYLPDQLQLNAVEPYDQAAARRPAFYEAGATGEINQARVLDALGGPFRGFTEDFLNLPGADPEDPSAQTVPNPKSLLRRAERFPEGSADRAMLRARANSISSALDVALKKVLARYP